MSQKIKLSQLPLIEDGNIGDDDVLFATDKMGGVLKSCGITTKQLAKYVLGDTAVQAKDIHDRLVENPDISLDDLRDEFISFLAAIVTKVA